MAGWVPMPADGWPDTAALLESTGQPWPDQASVTDLRWHVDQGRSIPGRPTLARRWNWPDRRVRALLADPERWWDPLRGPVPDSRPASVQPASSRRPAGVQFTAESSASDHTGRPADVQPTSSRRPADVHTRVDPPSPSPSPSTDPAGAPPPAPRAGERTRRGHLRVPSLDPETTGPLVRQLQDHLESQGSFLLASRTRSNTEAIERGFALLAELSDEIDGIAGNEQQILSAFFDEQQQDEWIAADRTRQTWTFLLRENALPKLQAYAESWTPPSTAPVQSIEDRLAAQKAASEARLAELRAQRAARKAAK